jgi:hypothetical protein
VGVAWVRVGGANKGKARFGLGLEGGARDWRVGLETGGWDSGLEGGARSEGGARDRRVGLRLKVGPGVVKMACRKSLLQGCPLPAFKEVVQAGRELGGQWVWHFQYSTLGYVESGLVSPRGETHYPMGVGTFIAVCQYCSLPVSWSKACSVALNQPLK